MQHKTPHREIPLPEDTASETAEVRGWEGLAEWTGGLPPEEIEPLAAVHDLEPVYPLLHALTGRSPRDFFARAAVVEALVESARAAFSNEDLDEILYWLTEPARAAVVRALSQSGWLEFDRAVSGYVLTDSGRWAHDVLSFLHRRLRESELLPTVAGVRYALDIGLDPLRHLQSMRSRLVALREEIDAALASHSEVVLRRTADKLGEAMALSGRIRAVLDAVRLDQVAARRVAREIHDLLSRLHGAGSELHAAITEVGKQYLRLTAGLTVEQIVRALMDKTLDELAAVGRATLWPALAPPPLLTTEAVAHAAEIQALRDRPAAPPVVWGEPDEAPRATDVLEAPPEVERLLADLARIHAATPLSGVIPASETGGAGESFLRASLLSLVGVRWAGEGIAGRLGALALKVDVEGDGWPEPLAVTAISSSLTRLTPGAVRPLDGEPD
ncbi:MAG TPA: hypothetical protein VH988_23045 [Thermoanaerobaculia bacterium]|jgi:hypothetical protein|nr:hypothetical protein [Thermoanaerobaculia bacterium]